MFGVKPYDSCISKNAKLCPIMMIQGGDVDTIAIEKQGNHM